MGAPVPAAPVDAAPAATLPPDAERVVARTDDGAGNSSEIVTVASNRSWFGALFAKGDMSVDSLIVCMIGSTIAFWTIVGYQVVTQRQIIGPLELGGGYAAMMATFGGVKTVRDRWGGPGQGQGG